MTHWTTTAGQRLFQARTTATLSLLVPAEFNAISDIEETQKYHSDTETGVFNKDVAPDLTSMPGILWIDDSPDLNCVPHVQIEMCTVIQNFELAQKIYCDIQKKFTAIMPEHFSDQTMTKWSDWMVSQQKIWDPTFHAENPISHSALTLPLPYQRRTLQAPCVEKSLIQDSAMDDEPDENEIILHNSDKHGTFNKQQRMEQIRLALSSVPECSKDATVFVGSAYTNTPILRAEQMKMWFKLGLES